VANYFDHVNAATFHHVVHKRLAAQHLLNIGHCGMAVATGFLLALIANAKGPQSALRQVKNPALGQKLGGVRGVLMVSQRRHVSSWRQ
jgi:hypothetical protein